MPCLIFSGMLSLMSFSTWRDHRVQGAFLQGCALLIGLAFAGKAFVAHQRRGQGDDQRVSDQPTWFLFLAVTCLLAWLAGLILGSSNYAARMSPYYDLSGMGIAYNVSPGDLPGTRHLDASRVVFKEGSRVAEELSLGFKDGTTYCVAPIVAGNGTDGTKLASFDYWAVGINCCNPLPPATFWCGRSDLTNPAAHGAVRWMGDSARGFFQLAIQQAEAEYGYQAVNPILYTWTKDPVADVEDMRSAGMDFLMGLTVKFALLQAIFVIGVIFFLSPTGMQSLGQWKAVAKASGYLADDADGPALRASDESATPEGAPRMVGGRPGAVRGWG
mmetsp:Transcript_84933/g.273332  ORF Transcript_84933/g.273332 Transcript_84933/m.273332 type:complete len:330 (+) Transcript_84933:132-1121(+)